ncbi:hypothetical protein EJB05_52101, partial [Eragrostis curvula]
IKDSRDESGRFSGVFSSSGSPRHGFSRSSSRLSMHDDTDDADFPFAVDDVYPDSRPGSSGGKETGDQTGSSSHKSQEAAVGYLVHLLKSARPLRDPTHILVFNCGRQELAMAFWVPWPCLCIDTCFQAGPSCFWLASRTVFLPRVRFLCGAVAVLPQPGPC